MTDTTEYAEMVYKFNYNLYTFVNKLTFQEIMKWAFGEPDNQQQSEEITDYQI